jgi:hypothetical protein
MLTAPRGLGTVCEKRSSADHAFAANELPSKSAQEKQGRKNSQNGVPGNLIPIMVSTTDRLVRTGTQRNSSWPGETNFHSKAEYIAADLSIAPTLSLAGLRRTIHCRYKLGFNERFDDYAPM